MSPKSSFDEEGAELNHRAPRESLKPFRPGESKSITTRRASSRPSEKEEGVLDALIGILEVYAMAIIPKFFRVAEPQGTILVREVNRLIAFQSETGLQFR